MGGEWSTSLYFMVGSPFLGGGWWVVSGRLNLTLVFREYLRSLFVAFHFFEICFVRNSSCGFFVLSSSPLCSFVFSLYSKSQSRLKT